MKINRIEIENFMNLSCDIAIGGPCNIFLGNNGQGKSALLDAIHWAFTGSLPHRGIRVKKGSGAQLSTDGGGNLRVAVHTSEGTVERTGDDKGDRRVAHPLTKGGVLEALMHSRKIITMTPAGRQKIFASLFDQTEDLSAQIGELCESQNVGGWTASIVRDMDDAEGLAVAQRQMAAAELKTLEGRSPREPNPTVNIGGRALDLREWPPDRVNSLIDERSKALGVIDSGASGPESDRELLEQLVSQKARHTEAVQQLNQLLETTRFEHHAAHKSWKTWQSREGEANAESQAITKTMSLLSRARSQGECPTCSSTISIDTIDTVIYGLKKNLTAAAEKAEKMSHHCNEAWTAWDAKSEIIRDTKTALAATTRESERVTDEIDQLERKIESAQKFKDDRGAVDKVREAVESYRKLLEHSKQYVNDQEDYKASRDAIVNVKKKWREADTVAKLLKSSGDLRKMAMEKQTISVMYDAALVDGWGLEPTILSDGTIELWGRPIELASQSEQYRASVLLSELLSRESQLKLLFLDGADVLADTRSQLKSRISAWSSEYDTILMNAAVADRPHSVPETPGTTYWWVEAGSVDKLN